MARAEMAKGARRQRKEPKGRESEELFERYLREQQIEFRYEPEIEGKQKHPDYHVCWSGVELRCEVKGLLGAHARKPRRAPSLNGGGGVFDPYKRIRDSIEDARDQFKEYKEHYCVLVLHNINDWEFESWPWAVIGAMQGDMGVELPFDGARLNSHRARPLFRGKGKMVVGSEVQNATFSAIAALKELTIPNPEFERRWEARLEALEKREGRKATLDESMELRREVRQELPSDLGTFVRLDVFDNPVARKPLPEIVFQGPYDARFRYDAAQRRVQRTFAGPELLRFEGQCREHVLQKLEPFVRGIVEKFAPERVILFGSHARGTARAESDVDLLVVFSGDGEMADVSFDIRRQTVCDFPLDLITRSAGEIGRRIALGDGFLEEVVEGGKVLYDACGSSA